MSTHLPLFAQALQAASSNGKTEAVAALVKLGADVNRVNHAGYNALHFATFSGNLETCKLLVELGARLDAESLTGDQPIDKAESLNKTLLADWMEAEMSRRTLPRVYGNLLFKDTQVNSPLPD